MRRISPAFLTVGMLGVVGLLVAAYFGKRLLAVDAPPPVEPVVIPMSLSDLKPGTRLTAGHVANGRIMPSKISPDMILNKEVLVGRVVKNPIAAVSPISTKDLFAPGENPPLELDPGMRAVTVPLGTETAAKPGQYVDVHFTPSSYPDSEDDGGMIMTLFKGVKILEMEGNSSGVRSSSTNVTLELTPEQANIILLAKDKGALHLVYTPNGKGSGIVAVEDENRATLYQILGIEPKPPVEPEEPFATDLFFGGGYRTHKFENGRRASGGYTPDNFESDVPAQSGGSRRSYQRPAVEPRESQEEAAPPSARANTGRGGLAL